MGIDIDELKSFVYAAQEGSFSAAARELGRAQSVISTHIANMEAELGYRLFVRSHRPILSEQGEQLLPYARHVIKEYARFDLRAKQIYGDVPLSLHIGLDHSLGNNAIMGLFEKLSVTHPQLRVQIESLNAFDVNWFFKNTEMAMAIVFSNATQFECPAFEIAQFPVSVIAGLQHPLQTRQPATVNDLRAYRQMVVTARDPESPPPVILSDDPWEVNSGAWALSLAAKNVGWTVLPQRQLALNPNLARKASEIQTEGISMPPERLMLLVRPDQTESKLVQWWKNELLRIVPTFERRPANFPLSPSSQS